jgi:nucleolar protein 56
MNYLFTNVIGNFVLDKKLKLVDEGTEKALKERYTDLEILPQKKVGKVLSLFKNKKNYEKFRNENLKLTRQSIKEAVSEDQLIIQSIANVNELVKVTNLLSKRLREWYSLYFPELSENVDDHETYVGLISTKTKEELMQEIKVKSSFGADLDEFHVNEIIRLSKEVLGLYKLRKQHEEYLEKVMRKYCPNLLELAGITTGAKLIELAKSLKRLAMLPASTIQLLGAEKALFRHIKTGSRSPKYGVIFQHPLIQRGGKNIRGKIARTLADKLSLCCRLDYFKGVFKGKEYREQLEKKFQ